MRAASSSTLAAKFPRTRRPTSRAFPASVNGTPLIQPTTGRGGPRRSSRSTPGITTCSLSAPSRKRPGEWRSVSSRFDEQAEPLLEREGVDLGGIELFGQGLGHSCPERNAVARDHRARTTPPPLCRATVR